MSEITIGAADQARLAQIVIGLATPDALPGADGDVYLDEEGTPVARREAGGVVPLVASSWPPPAAVFSDAPIVVAIADQLPAAPLPADAVLLLPAAGVRIDDARHIEWSAAWSATAAAVVRIPVTPADARNRVAELAAAYSSGPVVTVATGAQPAGAGRTILLTGLSGSGKSTIARALVSRLAASRSVTLLDGDVVRTHLSRGLGFSREDRDLNIRRIGWVAGEVTKHGGIAVCAPIAPYDETRQWVRATVEAAGGHGSFVLVWVSTSLAECERRDVKGLYAKARAGEITGFTGIDDPYEAPSDADLVIDTESVSVADAVESIINLLAR